MQCVAVCCSVEGEEPNDVCRFDATKVRHHVAVCCSVCGVLKCVAVCCSVLQCVAVCCSVLQCVAVFCSVLQRVEACCSVVSMLTRRNMTFRCGYASCTRITSLLNPRHDAFVCVA